MSYCRFAWEGSDVYVYGSNRGLECCGCRFDEGFIAKEPEEMIAHLARHRRAGHYVPQKAIERLWVEIPGAQRPSDGEPPTMTHASIEAEIWRLQRALKDTETRMNVEESAPHKENIG